MAAAPAGTSRDVAGASLKYMRRDQAVAGATTTLKDVMEERSMRVSDARAVPGGLSSWNLDTHGFALVKPPPAVDFLDSKLTAKEYAPKLVELAKKITGAKEGFFYMQLPRGNDTALTNRLKLPKDALGYFCHSDFGPSSPETLRWELVHRFGMSDQEAQNSEICMVNFWHPRLHPAYVDPLGLLDFSSVEKYEDCFRPVAASTMRLLYPQLYSKPDYIKMLERSRDEWDKSFLKETTFLLSPFHSPNHRWVFCPDMKPDEAWLFKQYDTRPGVARCAFHTSFEDPFHAGKDLPGNCPLDRRSAEFRVLLTFPKNQVHTPTTSKL